MSPEATARSTRRLCSSRAIYDWLTAAQDTAASVWLRTILQSSTYNASPPRPHDVWYRAPAPVTTLYPRPFTWLAPGHTLAMAFAYEHATCTDSKYGFNLKVMQNANKE